jgi:hypothetical protein
VGCESKLFPRTIEWELLKKLVHYFRDTLFMIKMTIATITTTKIIPVQTPALKIPAMASQLEIVIIKENRMNW